LPEDACNTVTSYNQIKIRQLLQHHGLRYSRPREVILGYFKERDQHISAEALHQSLKERGFDFSLSTIYLNLNVMTDAGLIRELSGVSGEAIYDSNLRPHHHLICKRCGAVMDLPSIDVAGQRLTDVLKEHAAAQTGWAVDEVELDVFGHCPGCEHTQAGKK
jgi:Fur family peroxide stress response transcriptional regulator